MSMIFDSLKKVKKRQTNTGIYPIITVKKKKRNKIWILFFLLIVAIVGVIGYYIYTPTQSPQTIATLKKDTGKEKTPKPFVKKENNTVENTISYSSTALPASEIPVKEKQQKIEPQKELAKKQLTAGNPDIKITKESSKVSLDMEREFKNYIVKGDEAYLQGNYKQAISFYEKALKIKEDIPTYMSLLSLYAQTGNIKKIEAVLKHPDLYPWIDEDIIAITIKNLADSNYKGSLGELEKLALSYDKTGRVYEAIGYFYEKRKKLAKALHYYKEAYRRNPENPDIAYRFASILQRTGNKTQAKEVYQKILELDIEPNFEKKIKVILKKLG